VTVTADHAAEPRFSATGRLFARLVDHPWFCLGLAALVTALAVSGYRDPGWARRLMERVGLAEAKEQPARGQPGPGPGRGLGRVNRGRGAAVGRGDAVLVVESPAIFSREGAAALRHIVARLESLDSVAGITWLDQAPPLNVFGLPEPILPRGPATPSRFAVALERAVNHPLVVGQLLSPDAGTTVMLVRFDWAYVDDEADVTEKLLATATSAAAEHPAVPLEVWLTGSVPLRLEWMRSREANEWKFQIIGYGLILALSAVLFRGLSVVAVTAAAPVIGVLWTMGLIRCFDLQDNPFSHVILPILLALVGFADSVHMMVDIRRGLAAGLTARAACHRGLATVGVACFLTMITTAIGMASLSLARHEAVRDFGWSCVIGVAATWLAVMAVLPLACVTRWGRVLAQGAGREAIGGQLPRIQRGIDFTLRHPRVTSAVAIGLLAACGLVALRLQPDDRKANILPMGSRAQVALDRLDRALGGLDVCSADVSWNDDAVTPAEVADVVSAVDELVSDEALLGHPQSIRRLIDALPGEGPVRERMTLLDLLPPPLLQSLYDPANRSARVTFRVQDKGTVVYKPTFDRVDAGLQAIAAAHPGFAISLSGEPIWRWRDLYHVVMDLARSLGTAAVEILVVMVVAFRSVRLGLIAIVPNMLPLAAAAVWMVLTGQPLDITRVCALTICLGIAVDDTIHFLSRYRFELAQGLPRLEAIRQAFAEVGTGMIMTTIVLVVGFSSVLISDNRDHRAFAMLGVVTLSIALVCDLFCLPALVAVFDREPAPPASTLETVATRPASVPTGSQATLGEG
jgi:predicted RND superfamily exporter protein